MMMHTTPKLPQAIHEIVKAPPSLKVDVVEKEPEVKRQATPALPLLHDLTPLDQLSITKKLKVRNVVLLKGRRNRYLVRSSDQALVYTIEEESSRWWAGYLCYGLRPLQLHVMNHQGAEILRIRRPYAFTGRCLPCQLQQMEIFSPPEELIGTVEQQWTAIKPLYLIKNEQGEQVFWIRGPTVTVNCFSDVAFEITRPDDTPVGTMSKRWQGLTHELFFAPVYDNFAVRFESGLSVEEKGLLLGATLLMDYMYFDV